MNSFRDRTPLRNVQFNQSNENNSNNSYEMGSRELESNYQRTDHVEAEQAENQDEHPYYSNRVHSLHRNRAFKSHDDLITGHEARVGASGVRTLGRQRNTGNMEIMFLNM